MSRTAATVGRAITLPLIGTVALLSFCAATALAQATAEPTATADAPSEARYASACDLAGPAGRLHVRLLARPVDREGPPAAPATAQLDCTAIAALVAGGAERSAGQAAQQAAFALTNSKLFAEVACQQAAPNLAVCDLTPQWLVRGYRLRGHWPFGLFGADIRRRISLRSGTLLDELPAALAAQRTRLLAYLAQEGYVDAAVSVAARPARSQGLTQGVDIHIEVHAKQSLSVRSVTLRGQVPVSAARLARPFFHRGWFAIQGRYRPMAEHEDVAKARAVLEDAGYIGSRLEVSARSDLATKAVDLGVMVRPGRRIKLQLSGDRVLSERKLKGLMPFADAGSVDGAAIDVWRESVRQALQEAGYADASVMVLRRPQVGDTIVLDVSVHAGAKGTVREVRYSGAPTAVFERASRAASLKQRRDGRVLKYPWVDGFVARDAQGLSFALTQQGFAGASAAPRRLATEGNSVLSWAVALGTHDEVSRITWHGVPPAVAQELRAQIWHLTPNGSLTAEGLEQDRQALLVACLRRGYHRAEVTANIYPVRDAFAVASGQDLASAAAEGQAGAKAALGQAGQANAEGDAQGQAEAEARLRAATSLPKQAYAIDFTCRAGPRATYAGLFVTGNVRTKASALLHELPFRTGAPLDALAVGRARRDLAALNIFQSVTLTPVTVLGQRAEGASREDSRTWLKLQLEERDVQTLDGILGFSSDYLFGIGADFRDANAFGRAIVFNALVNVSNAARLVPIGRIGRQDLVQLDLRAPHPFGLPVYFEAQGLARVQDVRLYKEERLGGQVAVSKFVLHRGQCRLCADVTLRLAYELQSTNRTDKGPLSTPPAPANADNNDKNGQDPNKTTIARLVPSIDADTRDSAGDPHTGFHFNLRLEGAHPDIAPTSPLHRSASRFWRVLLGGQAFVNLGVPLRVHLPRGRALGGPWVLALAGTLGMAQPFGRADAKQSVVPPSETFGYGGDASVRGLYARNSGAQEANPLRLATLSAELRLYLVENLGIGTLQLAGFVDVGTVSMRTQDLFQKTTVSVGPAVRYVTPVGPLSIAYGKAVLLPDELRTGGVANAPAPRRGRVHFTFGYTF